MCVRMIPSKVETKEEQVTTQLRILKNYVPLYTLYLLTFVRKDII